MGLNLGYGIDLDLDLEIKYQARWQPPCDLTSTAVGRWAMATNTATAVATAVVVLVFEVSRKMTIQNLKLSMYRKSWPKFKVERREKRPWGHPRTGRARPPRCLVRWRCGCPRSLITSRRSAGRDLGRNSAVPPAVSQPFLRRFSTQMDENLGF
jgi:hypothetical protein